MKTGKSLEKSVCFDEFNADEKEIIDVKKT